MQRLRPQFTIRQLMIGVGSIGLILALVNGVRRGDPLVIVILLLVAPSLFLLGTTIGLTFLKPAVTRWLFLACCLVVLLVSGYCFVVSAMIGQPIGGEWLFLGLSLIILTFGFGHLGSKNVHVWRADNRKKRGAGRPRSDPEPPSLNGSGSA